MPTYAVTQDRHLHVHAIAPNDVSPVTLLVTGPDGQPARHPGARGSTTGTPGAARWDLRDIVAGTVITTEPDDAKLIVHDLATMDVIFSG